MMVSARSIGPTPEPTSLDPKPNILVVEDDAPIRHLIIRLLRENGFRAFGARDGEEMWRALAKAAVDLVLLDIMLPGQSGLELLCALRIRHAALPVVMVTAEGGETDRVRSLDLGAEDYLAKPFGRQELLLRIRAVLRRVRLRATVFGEGASRWMRFQGWSLDTARRDLLSPAGAVIDLSSAEFDLLVAFLEHPQQMLTRDKIFGLLYDRLADPNDRSVDVLVSRLRRKLKTEEGDTAMIMTVRGTGYSFLPRVEREA
ncbi:response regulator transcription factor [Paeniroseomonas aquatica]